MRLVNGLMKAGALGIIIVSLFVLAFLWVLPMFAGTTGRPDAIEEARSAMFWTIYGPIWVGAPILAIAYLFAQRKP